MAQVELLQALTDMAPTRISDLAERLHLANSTISGLIGQMISRGLVLRQIDRADRRAAVVTLTEAGRERLTEWERVHEERIGQAFQQLPGADRHAIALALPALGRLTQLLGGAHVMAGASP
jgi:DNA-binding MarR family transcriptional regulator